MTHSQVFTEELQSTNPGENQSLIGIFENGPLQFYHIHGHSSVYSEEEK